MSEIIADTPDLGLPFDPSYWGEVHAQEPDSIHDRALIGQPTTEGVAVAFENLQLAIVGILRNRAVINHVQEGEQLNLFNPSLSMRHYQCPGTVLLLDIEQVGESWREVTPTEDAPALFAGSASGLLKHAIMQPPHQPRGDVQFSNQENPHELYERTVRTFVMSETRKGASYPLEARKLLTLPGDKAIFPVKEVQGIPARGMPIIGRTYEITDDNGEPIALRRIRSAEVIAGSVRRSRQRETVRQRIGRVTGSLFPLPEPSPTY